MTSRRVLLFLAALALFVMNGAAAKGLLGKKDDKKAAPAVDKAATIGSHNQDYYWYNTVTGVSRWDDPMPVHKDEASGVDYYVDPATGESSWEKPAAYAWKEAFSEDHKTHYFYNEVTGESVWEKPEAMAWTRVRNSGNGEL